MALNYENNKPVSLDPWQRKAAIVAGATAFVSPIGQAVVGKNLNFNGGMFRHTPYQVGKSQITLAKQTALSTALLVPLAGAAGVGKGMWEARQELRAGSVSYYGNAPALDADASVNVDRTTGARTFGADGQLVFGLNSGRHGK